MGLNEVEIFGKSFMHRRNKIGDNTEPWGRPRCRGFGVEKALFISIIVEFDKSNDVFTVFTKINSLRQITKIIQYFGFFLLRQASCSGKLNTVDLLFVQFILVQPVFVQPVFVQSYPNLI